MLILHLEARGHRTNQSSYISDLNIVSRGSRGRADQKKNLLKEKPHPHSHFFLPSMDPILGSSLLQRRPQDRVHSKMTFCVQTTAKQDTLHWKGARFLHVCMDSIIMTFCIIGHPKTGHFISSGSSMWCVCTAHMCYWHFVCNAP